jgi:SAM-dependent methyltransferase
MRDENLPRLAAAKISITHPHYLHYKSLFRDLKYSVEKYSKGDVFDIGCGNKPYQNLFEGRITSYIGCDVAQSDQNKVDIICPATDIKAQSESFDTVFSTQVLEHVEEPQKMINEAFRVLRAKGYLVISAPFYWEHHEEPYDFFRYTKYGFEYLLKTAGFEIVEVIPNGGKWAVAGQAFLNNCYSSFNRKNRQARHQVETVKKKKTILKLPVTLFRIILTVLVNLIFGWLDKVDFDSISTLNWVIVAKKK